VSRAAPPATEAQARASFERAVQGAVERSDGPRSCRGFDDEVELALERLARAYPNATPELIAAA
jgi:hypothetical protein